MAMTQVSDAAQRAGERSVVRRLSIGAAEARTIA